MNGNVVTLVHRTIRSARVCSRRATLNSNSCRNRLNSRLKDGCTSSRACTSSMPLLMDTSVPVVTGTLTLVPSPHINTTCSPSCRARARALVLDLITIVHLLPPRRLNNASCLLSHHRLPLRQRVQLRLSTHSILGAILTWRCSILLYSHSLHISRPCRRLLLTPAEEVMVQAEVGTRCLVTFSIPNLLRLADKGSTIRFQDNNNNSTARLIPRTDKKGVALAAALAPAPLDDLSLYT